MSHKLFRHSILSNARVWDFLKQVDAAEAEACREWQAKRGELAAPPGEPPLRWLLRVMRGRGLRARLLRSLVWLMPWTGFCTLGAGPAAPAESVSVMNG